MQVPQYSMYWHIGVTPGSIPPKVIESQPFQEAVPLCEVPRKRILWWTIPDNSKTCLSVYVVDSETGDGISNVPVQVMTNVIKTNLGGLITTNIDKSSLIGLGVLEFQGYKKGVILARQIGDKPVMVIIVMVKNIQSVVD